MKKPVLILFILFCACFAQAQVTDFQLKDVISGRNFSLMDHKSSKALVLLFTTNSCPFSKLYEDRIIELNQKFQNQGVKFVLINPHANQSEEETEEEMVKRARTRNFDLPYLADSKQAVTRTYNITKIPEVVVINSGPTGLSIVYKGAIDNNPQIPESANMKYLDKALTNILNRRSVSPANTRAVGCNVRLLN